MGEITHYGVRGMKWKEHIIKREEQPNVNIIKHPSIIQDVKTGPGKFISPSIASKKIVINPARYMKKNMVGDDAKTKRKRKMKEISPQMLSSGKKVVSSMAPLMSKTLSQIALPKVYPNSKMRKSAI